VLGETVFYALGSFLTISSYISSHRSMVFRFQKIRSLPDANRLILFGPAASRLVEDVLADLDRLNIFFGPIWADFPIVEIHSTIG
jgi:hypothetical protein